MPRWTLIAAGGGLTVGAIGLGAVVLVERSRFEDCAGADVEVCLDRYRSDARRAYEGGEPWAELSPQVREAEIRLYGIDQTATRSRLVTASAVGLAVLGSGVLTLGIVW